MSEVAAEPMVDNVVDSKDESPAMENETKVDIETEVSVNSEAGDAAESTPAVETSNKRKADDTEETDENPPVKRVKRMEGKKPGDWNCEGCGHLNYGFRTHCQKCSGARPAHLAGAQPRGPSAAPSHGGKPGDWSCSKCTHHNYNFRHACQRCNTPKPGGGYSHHPHPHHYQPQQQRYAPQQSGKHPGDWNCPRCFDLQYASRSQCRKCGTPKPFHNRPGPPHHYPHHAPHHAAPSHHQRYPQQPPRDFREGDWMCASCNNHNYKSRTACRRCNAEKQVAAAPSGYDNASSTSGSYPPAGQQGHAASSGYGQQQPAYPPQHQPHSQAPGYGHDQSSHSQSYSGYGKEAASAAAPAPAAANAGYGHSSYSAQPSQSSHPSSYPPQYSENSSYGQNGYGNTNTASASSLSSSSSASYPPSSGQSYRQAQSQYPPQYQY